MKRVTREHVQRAVDGLRDMGLLSDTTPNPDGTRGPEQWLNAIREDAGLVQYSLRETIDHADELGRDEIVRKCAYAQKEARRMLSDIGRFAREVHGISQDEINKVGPL